MIFRDVENKLKEKEYEQKLEYPKKGKLNSNHVFDENLSVKQNRKMVEEYNQKIDKEKEAYREEGYRLRNEFYDDILNVLMDEYSFSQKIATIVLNRANTEYSHCSREEFISQVEDLADFTQKLLNA